MDYLSRKTDPQDGQNNRFNFSNVIRQSIAACLIGIIVAGSALYYYDYRKTTYIVRYNGKLLGYVKDKKIATDAFEGLKEDIKKIDPSIAINGDLSFEKTMVDSKNPESSKDVGQELKSNFYKSFTSYAISVNNNEIAIVESEEDANKVIEGVKKYFAEQEAKEDTEVLEVNVKDEIKVTNKIVNASKVVGVETAINALTGKKSDTKKYEIKQGDTLWTIARSNNVSVDEITAANPGLNVEKIQPGQSINLSANIPNVNVELTLKKTTDEQISYNTEYTTDSSLYKGQTKVVKSGESGLNRIISKITKLNGAEVAKTVLASTVVKNPVIQVVAKGTKDIVGSGAFSWPARGNLTSGFGSRSGEFHAGVDICAPQGTPIYASDGGTVVQAGWYYGYGKLVIINHGNGYQTYYGHCSEIYVNVGQSVTRGQNIAAIGHTGDAYGDHVHFEVRLNGSAQNPSKYLK